jgi:parvulin-like peptidyl-prolyl isomerase
VRGGYDILFAMLALLLSLPLGGAATAPQETTSASGGSAPFLRIDGEAIGGDEYGRWLLSTQGEHQARDFALKYWVVDREAKRLGLELPQARIERAVEAQFRERITGAFLGSREEWLAELSRTGRSEAGVRRQRIVEMRPELEARAIAALDRVVPEYVIEREWELRHGRRGRRYDLRMIQFKVVVDSPPRATREEWEAGRKKAMEEVREKALTVRERALAGEDFGLLASRYSDDPDTRDHRGVPSGGFSHFGWPHSFLDALEALAPGGILEPTYARGGWWIVELRSVQATPLESVRREIEADLLARGPEPYEVGMVQDRLADGAFVQVLPELLASPREGEWPGALDPVLRIDGETVGRGEYARWLVDTIGETLVDRFAEEWLVRRKARAEGVEVDEGQVAARTREYVQALIDGGYHGDREAWVAYLDLGGRSEDAFLRDIAWRTRIDLLTEKMFQREREVRPADVRARFADTYGESGRRVEVRMIELAIRPPDPGPDLTRDELDRRMAEASETTRRHAEALVVRARSGEEFAALARATSEDASTREQGGALPGRFRPDQWPDGISSAVQALKTGEVTDPHLHGHDWLIFQVASVRQVTFEEVEKELERELSAERPSLADLAGYRNALLKRARVEVLPEMHR